jgi:hypothetical protein
MIVGMVISRKAIFEIHGKDWIFMCSLYFGIFVIRYMIQHYVIKFVSDFWQVGGFLQVLKFPLPIKLTVII